MKKRFHYKVLSLTIGLLITVCSFSQVKVGDSPTIVNPDAVLEIESTNKGMLLPRIALTNTANATPLSAHVEGMTVYNTATTGLQSESGNGDGNVAIGRVARTSTGNDNIAIGRQTTSDGTNNISIGRNITTKGGKKIIVINC